MMKGFYVVNYPRAGILGLICGDAHTPSKAVTSHMKYKRAVKNGVPLLTMDELPSIIGINNWTEDLAKLKMDIVMKKCGDSRKIVHYIWRGRTRFIVLPLESVNALCRKEFDSKVLRY